MTVSAFDRLLRVFELEEKQGWRNRAVIGGMQAMADRWQADAEAEQSDLRIVQAVVMLMGEYDAAEPDNRPALANTIRQILAGDLAVLQELDLVVEEQAIDVEYGGVPSHDLASEAPTGPVSVERSRRSDANHHFNPHDLQSAPDVLPGVGSATAEQLARLGIVRVVDLLWHLPTRHEDYSKMRTIAQLEPGEHVTVIANLWDVKDRKISMKRQVVQGILADGTGTLHATWWNKYVRNQLKPGTTLRFSGKVGLYLGQKTLDNPVFEDVDEEMVATGRLSPVYGLTEGMSNKRLRGLIKLVLDGYVQYLTDPLPAEIRGRYDLPDLSTALRCVHFPDNHEQLQSALRRLAFEEFFYIQLGVLQRRRELQQATAQPLFGEADVLAQFKAQLPFTLTAAQDRVLDEIAQDMRRTVPMTRLIQGDVGSGKTAIAAGAMFVAAVNGAQSALLAPTQILAEQHYRGLVALLGNLTRGDGSTCSVALLTGRVTSTERMQIAEGLRSGDIDVVVGTTAIIQESVEFNNLGFVVVDEQHRFGVEQRGALRSKGGQPHLLVMSATPIPRSLALTVYGDLDISVIDEMPPGRMPVKTKWFRPRERERLYAFMRREANAGRQGFIVYPLVEESDKLDAGAAVSEYERLQQEVFPDLRLALLHGRMTGQEKDAVMSAFAAGTYDILVSTSVIEVGIDVPNASLILIEDAERFGLAQLHQLRGRVGRGDQNSYCALVSKVESGEAQERLRALEETTSGFELAEKDLALRGPGDFLGTKQSGLPDLRVAQLSDMKTLSAARGAAETVFQVDPALEQYEQLAKQVQRFWRGQGSVS